MSSSYFGWALLLVRLAPLVVVLAVCFLVLVAISAPSPF
jgi:hypothetical protein